MDGQDGDGINAGYNSLGGVGPDRPIFTSATICISKRPVAGTWHYSQRHAGCVTCQKYDCRRQSCAYCYYRRQFGGLRTGQSGSLIRLGDDATIETSGASSTGIYAASSSRTELGNNATITVNGASAHAVYATNATVNLGENATISVNSASKAASYSKAPAGLYALSRGAINLAGGAAITMAGDNSSESYAISTETGGIVDGSSGGRFVIDGDIRAAGATAASGTLPQQNSTIKLNMTDNSRWDGASYITSATAGTGVISVQMSDATGI